MITYNEIKNDKNIKTYIEQADKSLLALGYTEHSYAHVGLVSHRAEYILKCLGYGDRDIELTKILKTYYDSYHFREEVLENDIKFDYVNICVFVI